MSLADQRPSERLAYLDNIRTAVIKATISSTGQIAIPKAVLDRLNLKSGTEISIDVQGESLVMKRLAGDLPDWRTMQGMVKGGDSLTQALEEEHCAELIRDDDRLQSR